jgi:hypothetical protein
MSKYLFRKNKVLFDEKKELYYVITKEGEKLYFKKGLSKKDVSHLYNSLCAEQDTLSPHKYDFDHLSITSNVVLADIGAAKGNFSLKYIDKIKKNILIRNR